MESFEYLDVETVGCFGPIEPESCDTVFVDLQGHRRLHRCDHLVAS
jgi:hypothetical protein